MIDKNTISEWLKAGAPLQRGLQLFSLLFPDNKHFPSLVHTDTARYGKLLSVVLKRHFGIVDISDTVVVKSPKLRDEYPFLSKDDCPNELKILVTDKISSYRNFCAAHDDLFSCLTLEECYVTAKRLIVNFLNNRAITSELEYYQEHGVVLGLHSIFKELESISMFKSMDLKALFHAKKRLEGNLWRANNEIKKGSKPHLLDSRESRVRFIQRQLREIEHIIEGYGVK